MTRSAPPVLQRIAQLRGFARVDESEHFGTTGELPVLSNDGNVVGMLALERVEGVSEEFAKLASRPIERDERAASFKKLERLEREVLELCVENQLWAALVSARDELEDNDLPEVDTAFDVGAFPARQWLTDLDRQGRAEATKRIASWLQARKVALNDRLLARFTELGRLRELLLRTNLGLVYSSIKVYGFKLEFPLALMAGCQGLIIAMDRFDPSLNTQFSTYASWWIRQTISRVGNNHGAVLRLPIHAQDSLRSFVQAERREWSEAGTRPDAIELIAAEELAIQAHKIAEWRRTAKAAHVGRIQAAGCSAEHLLDADLPPPLDGALKSGYIECLEEAVRALCERAIVDEAKGRPDQAKRGRAIVYGRLGIGRPKQTLHDIGETQGVSRERIRQLESKLLARAARLLEGTSSDAIRELWDWKFDDE